MNTRISSKGQLVLPASIRERDQIEAGDEFWIRRVKSGTYVLQHKKAGSGLAFIDALEKCPVKGWFERVPSESTEEL